VGIGESPSNPHHSEDTLPPFGGNPAKAVFCTFERKKGLLFYEIA
jgi:hypothetical protein